MPKRKVSTTGSPWDPKWRRIELVPTVSRWVVVAKKGIAAARRAAQKKLAAFFVVVILGATAATILVAIYEWVMEEETAMGLLAKQFLEFLLSKVFPEVVVEAVTAVVL